MYSSGWNGSFFMSTGGLDKALISGVAFSIPVQGMPCLSFISGYFFFLPSDPREKSPMLVNLIHLKSPFNRMRLRHELWKKKYPDLKEKHGVPFTGIENASAEVKSLAKPPVDLRKLPFDPLEYIEHLDELPFDPALDPALGR